MTVEFLKWKLVRSPGSPDRIKHLTDPEPIDQTLKPLGPKVPLANYFFGFDIKQRNLFQVELDGHLFP
jgi:hypothetical protein